MIHPAATTSLLMGISLLAFYAWVTFKPDTALLALKAYPRTVWPGRIFTAVCLVWFARNLWQVDLGGFNDLKKLLYVAVPVGICLIVVLLPDLLSVRGLCVFFLLAGQPLLIATRWSGTPASLAVALMTYLLLIKSMVLVVYPHLWNRGITWWENHPESRKPGLGAGVLVGCLLVGSGLLSL